PPRQVSLAGGGGARGRSRRLAAPAGPCARGRRGPGAAEPAGDHPPRQAGRPEHVQGRLPPPPAGAGRSRRRGERWMIVIYGSSLSPFARKAMVFATEKGLSFETKPGGRRFPSPEFAAASPFGKIPAMTHGDFALADSTAIVTYFDA